MRVVQVPAPSSAVAASDGAGTRTVPWSDCSLQLKQVSSLALFAFPCRVSCCCLPIVKMTMAKHCGEGTGQLQALAGQLFELPRSSSSQHLLLDTLRVMQSLRNAVNLVHLEDSNGDTAQDVRAQVRASQDFVKRVCSALGSTIECPTMKQLQQQRLQQIQREIDCALALRGRGIDANHLPADTSIAAICALVRRLREMEKSQEFHRNLLRAQREISAGSVYTLDNFAYGSTPFPTWLQIVSADSVRSAIAALRSSCANRWRCTVFGSSTGSLVFYAALALGVDCVGVEILPFLYNVSTKLRDEIVPAEVRMRCEFVCEDMLQTPLGTTSLLILTSQCWDNDLHKQVARKLERELPAGAAVVDYKDSLRRSSSFRLEERLEGLPVSWAHKQPLYVFRKCPR